MVITRFRVLILAAIAAAILWIEHAQRIRIEAQTPPDAAAQAAGCPSNESSPFSPACLAFIGASGPPDDGRLIHPDPLSIDSPELR
jgi:hypothetical protein